MAIDTEQKRRSAGTHFLLTTNPVPSGSVGSLDLPHVAWVYRGIPIVLIRLEVVRVKAFINSLFRKSIDL